LLWYGKLPKVSIYHQQKQDYNHYSIYNDDLTQSQRNISINGKKEGVTEFVSTLHNDPEFRYINPRIEIPIFNSDHEKIGTETLYSFITNLKDNYIIKLRYENNKSI
jgi:hypothetical protein